MIAMIVNDDDDDDGCESVRSELAMLFMGFSHLRDDNIWGFFSNQINTEELFNVLSTRREEKSS